MNIQPFKIAIPQSTLNDLHERLARTCWPDEVEGSGWSYGTNLDYLKSLVAYWQHEYDWRKQEATLNRYTQFRTDLDGLSIHFIHERGKDRSHCRSSSPMAGPIRSTACTRSSPCSPTRKASEAMRLTLLM